MVNSLGIKFDENIYKSKTGRSKALKSFLKLEEQLTHLTHWDFSKFVFTKGSSVSQITCNLHDTPYTFNRTIYDIVVRKKDKCPMCIGKVAKVRPVEFEHRVKTLGKGDYVLLTPYTGSDKKVEMLHNICGTKFKITPNSFTKGVRCAKCSSIEAGKKLSKINRKPTGTFLTDMSNKYSNFNEFDIIGEYAGSNNITTVIHICGTLLGKTGNAFYEPRKKHNLLYCPICHRTELNKATQILKFDNNKPTSVYFLYFKHLGIYKVGITTRTIYERIKALGAGFIENTEILHLQTFSTVKTALTIEQNILKRHKDNLVLNGCGLIRGGYTELLKHNILTEIVTECEIYKHEYTDIVTRKNK